MNEYIVVAIIKEVHVYIYVLNVVAQMVVTSQPLNYVVGQDCMGKPG